MTDDITTEDINKETPIEVKDVKELKTKKKRNRKRKEPSNVEAVPIKKTKVINDGFCLYIGNLNHHNTYEMVKDSLANHLMKKSLLVQDIRLDRARKHAFVDLASEMDLTKALTLDGDTILDKPMKIAKAKVKTVEVAPEEKNVSQKTLFVSGLSEKTTIETLKKVFNFSVSAKITLGKRYGFVKFESEELCKLSKKEMEDCEIDGQKVSIAFAKGRANTKDSTAALAGPKADKTK